MGSPDEPLPWDRWRRDWRFATAEVDPIPGRIKVEHGDFQVEELLSFEPSGDGEHLFLFLEKRGRTTPDVGHGLARHFDVESKDVGWAGRKDARGVTRQWFSVRGAAAARLEDLEDEGLRLLRHTRNDRKLRLGALKGNRFQVRVRDVSSGDRAGAERVLEQLREEGLPNYFGPQRFGVHGLAPELGALLLSGRSRAYLLRRLHPDHTPDTPATARLREAIEVGKRGPQRSLSEITGDLPREFVPLARQLARRPGDWNSALRSLDRSTLRLHLSAWQAAVFNGVLSERFEDRREPRRGDLLQVLGSNSLFEVSASEDLDSLRGRCASLELAVSGPLPGNRAPLASGQSGELERAWIRALGHGGESFELPVKGLALPGARRPFQAPLDSLRWSWEAAGLRLDFQLPAGAYATSLVAELTKKP